MDIEVDSSEAVDLGICSQTGDVSANPGEQSSVAQVRVQDLLITPRRSPRLKAIAEADGKKVTTPTSQEQVPAVGMVFDTMEEVEEMYKRYAQKRGFAITRAQGSYATNKKRRATTWRCECWGDPETKAKRVAKEKAKTIGIGGSEVDDQGKVVKRNTKKCFCTAMVYASLDEGKWVIRKVVLEHSGHMPSPSKALLVKEYRMQHFSKGVKRKLMNDIEVGIPIAKIHSSLTRERGGYANMPITEKDMRHVVNKERNLRVEGGDSNALISYFDKMQGDNSNFFHTHRLDWEGKMKDVLWVDARSRAAYEEFSDVVCFDTTYLTNEYTLPFANFVGINHHGQSILFGCALISTEDCDTFEWVFRQWLRCMRGKEPVGILTDQAAAMRRPLEEVMPNARHRWCIWHILQKVPSKLRYHERYGELKEDLLNVVYNSLTIDEFESGWASFIGEYGLEEDEWLTNLFVERHMWVPTFMKDHFWAGMRTTQRVESINSFFDQFLFRHTMLCEFGERYIAAVEKRANDERTADAKSEKWVRKYQTGYHAERFFRKYYTNNKFREVQTECEKLSYCYVVEEKRVDESTIQYLMEDRVWVVPEGCSDEVITSRRTYYCVTFNHETKESTCACRKFETHGIMCRHLIRVYDKNHIQDIPHSFVLRRWRKDIPRRHSKIPASLQDPTRVAEVKRLDKINGLLEPITDLAVKKDKFTDIVMNGLKTIEADLLAAVEEDKSENPVQSVSPGSSSVPPLSDSFLLRSSASPLPHSQCSETPSQLDVSSTPTSRQTQGNIKDPPIPKKRGRPRTTRFKPAHEVGASKGKSKSKGSLETMQGGKRKQAIAHTPAGLVGTCDGAPVGGGAMPCLPSALELSDALESSDAPEKLPVKRRRKSVSFADVKPNITPETTTDDELLARYSLSFD